MGYRLCWLSIARVDGGWWEWCKTHMKWRNLTKSIQQGHFFTTNKIFVVFLMRPRPLQDKEKIGSDFFDKKRRLRPLHTKKKSFYYQNDQSEQKIKHTIRKSKDCQNLLKIDGFFTFIPCIFRSITALSCERTDDSRRAWVYNPGDVVTTSNMITVLVF